MKEKHVLAYDQKYGLKIKVKCLVSKAFDKESRKRDIKQATYRRNEKQKELKEQVTRSSSPSSVKKRRSSSSSSR